MTYMSGEEIEETLIFQDFVTEKLYEIGWSINAYSSKKYNIEKGESIAGIEIKNDKLMRKTGNLYIEIYERQKTDNSFVKGGILRDDNTILYFIGDFEEAFIISKKILKKLYFDYKKYNFRYVETPTSKGILIPIEFIVNNCLDILHLRFEEKIIKKI